jgi:hypothetical protein
MTYQEGAHFFERLDPGRGETSEKIWTCGPDFLIRLGGSRIEEIGGPDQALEDLYAAPLRRRQDRKMATARHLAHSSTK